MVTDKRWPEKHGHYSVQVGYERYTPDKCLGMVKMVGEKWDVRGFFGFNCWKLHYI